MERHIHILAADSLAEEGLEFIRGQPDTVLAHKPGLSVAELSAIIGDYDGLIVRSGVQITSEVLASAGKLRAIVRAGVGVDNIDVDAATAKGIVVMNSAEASTTSTAEHAFALMLALTRHIGHAYVDFRDGGWDRSQFSGNQLSGKTLGVIGFGRIGQAVATRAIAFEMNVVAYDPFINATTMMDGRVKMYQSFTELLPHVDILTFHVPLNDQTRSMLSAETLEHCRHGVMIVNASRGGVVNESDLLAALDSGVCRGLALDVFATEPPPADHPMRDHPRVLVTPHLGASTQEAQEAVSVAAAKSLLAFLRDEGLSGAVNIAGFRVDLDPIQCGFVDLARRMAQLIGPMITAGIGEITIALQGDDLTAAATTIERHTLVALLSGHIEADINVVNVRQAAELRGISLRTMTVDDEKNDWRQLSITVQSCGTERERRIVGRVYDDNRPRVVEINGYHMDMIPDGAMVMIQNDDRPGMIGLVGTTFGAANVNIADMAISRRGDTALMVLKVDDEPDDATLQLLRDQSGILKVAKIVLAPLLEPSSS